MLRVNLDEFMGSPGNGTFHAQGLLVPDRIDENKNRALEKQRVRQQHLGRGF